MSARQSVPLRLAPTMRSTVARLQALLDSDLSPLQLSLLPAFLSALEAVAPVLVPDVNAKVAAEGSLLLTVRQVGEALGVSGATVYAYVKGHGLPTVVLPGGQARVVRSELISWINNLPR